MKCILVLLSAVAVAWGQTGTASIAGTVLDAKTQKPVPAAWVTAIQNGLPPFSKNTKSGGAGEFQISDLPAGAYSLCVQVPGSQYLNPCQWNGTPTVVALVSGQAATGVSLRLTAASLVSIEVRDAQDLLKQSTKEGRRPELTVGVWGPKGLYYPARAVPGPIAAGNPLSAAKAVNSYNYQIAIPRDTALKLHIASKDVTIGDASGARLAENASQQSFQHASAEANPKSFVFTVVGRAP